MLLNLYGEMKNLPSSHSKANGEDLGISFFCNQNLLLEVSVLTIMKDLPLVADSDRPDLKMGSYVAMDIGIQL